MSHESHGDEHEIATKEFWRAVGFSRNSDVLKLSDHAYKYKTACSH